MSSYLRAAAKCIGNTCASVSNPYSFARRKAITAYNKLSVDEQKTYWKIVNALLLSKLTESERMYIIKTGVINYHHILRALGEAVYRVPDSERFITKEGYDALRSAIEGAYWYTLSRTDLIMYKDIPDSLEGLATITFPPVSIKNRGNETNRNKMEALLPFVLNVNVPTEGGSRKKKRTVKRKRTQRRR